MQYLHLQILYLQIRKGKGQSAEYAANDLNGGAENECDRRPGKAGGGGPGWRSTPRNATALDRPPPRLGTIYSRESPGRNSHENPGRDRGCHQREQSVGFEQDYMGRGPKDIHAHLLGDPIRDGLGDLHGARIARAVARQLRAHSRDRTWLSRSRSFRSKSRIFLPRPAPRGSFRSSAGMSVPPC
jgi:hypothetical protein